MGSNINAIIAQGPRPIDTPTPQQRMAQTLTLRSAMQGQQLQQEQIQAAQQENQQRAIQMDQMRSMNDAYKSAMTIGADGMPTIDRQQLTTTLARGGHGSAIPGILKQLDEIDKAHVDLQEAKGKVEVQERDAGGAIGAMARAAKYDPGVLMMGLSDAVRRGAVPGQHVAPLIKQLQDAQAQDAQNPGSKAAQTLTQQIADHLITLSPKQQELDNAAKTADARDKQANVEIDKAQLAKDQTYQQRAGGAQSQEQLDQIRNNAKAAGVSDAAIAQMPSMYSPAGMDAYNRQNMNADQRATVDETAKRDQQTAGYQNSELKIRGQANSIAQQNANTNAGRLTTERQKLGFDMSQAGEANGDVQMALTARMSPPTLHAIIRSRPGFLNQLTKADPKFDEAKIEKRYDVVKDFGNTNPQRMGGQSIALNTMVHHADLFMQAADQLKNGTFRPGNALYNAIATEFGKAPPTNGKLLAQFLVGETGKLVGEGTEGAQNKLLEALDTSKNSDEQLRGAANTLIGIAGGRAKPWLEKIQDAGADNVVPFIGKDAKEILTKYGYDPETMHRRQGPAGSGRPAAAAAPPLPSQLSQADIGKTYMNRAGQMITIRNVDPKNPKRFAYDEAK